MEVPFAKNVTAQIADNGEDIALVFETVTAGDLAVAITGASFSKFIMLLLQQAEKVAISKASKADYRGPTDIEVTKFNPVVCSALGIAKGSTNSEIALYVEVGNARFQFLTDTSSIEGLFEDFHDLDNLGTGARREQ